jgi:hypothetical protein
MKFIHSLCVCVCATAGSCVISRESLGSREREPEQAPTSNESSHLSLPLPSTHLQQRHHAGLVPAHDGGHQGRLPVPLRKAPVGQQEVRPQRRVRKACRRGGEGSVPGGDGREGEGGGEGPGPLLRRWPCRPWRWRCPPSSPCPCGVGGGGRWRPVVPFGVGGGGGERQQAGDERGAAPLLCEPPERERKRRVGRVEGKRVGSVERKGRTPWTAGGGGLNRRIHPHHTQRSSSSSIDSTVCVDDNKSGSEYGLHQSTAPAQPQEKQQPGTVALPPPSRHAKTHHRRLEPLRRRRLRWALVRTRDCSSSKSTHASWPPHAASSKGVDLQWWWWWWWVRDSLCEPRAGLFPCIQCTPPSFCSFSPPLSHPPTHRILGRPWPASAPPPAAPAAALHSHGTPPQTRPPSAAMQSSGCSVRCTRVVVSWLPCLLARSLADDDDLSVFVCVGVGRAKRLGPMVDRSTGKRQRASLSTIDLGPREDPRCVKVVCNYVCCCGAAHTALGGGLAASCFAIFLARSVTGTTVSSLLW